MQRLAQAVFPEAGGTLVRTNSLVRPFAPACTFGCLFVVIELHLHQDCMSECINSSEIVLLTQSEHCILKSVGFRVGVHPLDVSCARVGTSCVSEAGGTLVRSNSGASISLQWKFWLSLCCD